MITVKVELWPRGDESTAREIGRMYIANVGGTVERGDYEVAVCRRNSDALPQPINPNGPKPTRSGSVKNYPRLSYNMWRLICRALASSFPEEWKNGERTPDDEDLPFADPKPCDSCADEDGNGRTFCGFCGTRLADLPRDAYGKIPG